MLKKSFGVAFGAVLIAVASYGAGCSSTSVDNPLGDAGGGGTDAHHDGTVPGDDAGDDGPGDDGGGNCPAKAPTKADIDQPDGAPGWNPPKARQTTACSASDLTKFSDNLNNQNLATWDDLVTGLPTSCAQCILSRETDSNWQIIVADATGKNGFVNWGACYADAPHGAAACGQADQYLNFCVDISCNGCATQADFDSCTGSKAVSNACDSAFGPALQAGCPQQYAQELDTQCGQIVNAAAIVCGNGVLPDGGQLTD